MTRHGWREKKAGAPNLQASSWIPPIFYFFIFFLRPRVFFSGCRPCSSLSRNWATMGLTGFFWKGAKAAQAAQTPTPPNRAKKRDLQNKGALWVCGRYNFKMRVWVQEGQQHQQQQHTRIDTGGWCWKDSPSKAFEKVNVHVTPPSRFSRRYFHNGSCEQKGGQKKKKIKNTREKEEKTKRKKKRKEGINTNVHTTEAIFFSHVRYSCAVTRSFQDRELFNNRCHTISRDCRWWAVGLFTTDWYMAVSLSVTLWVVSLSV